jgi:hypothetical protein
VPSEALCITDKNAAEVFCYADSAFWHASDRWWCNLSASDAGAPGFARAWTAEAAVSTWAVLRIELTADGVR